MAGEGYMGLDKALCQQQPQLQLQPGALFPAGVINTKAHGYTVVEGCFFGASYISMAISMIGIELMEKVEGHPPFPSRR
jgi:hypothetical protein